MSASSSRRTRLAASTLFAGFAALAALTACSAGLIAQTADQVAAVPGANGNFGPGGVIALRDVAVAYNGPEGYPQGGTAPLSVRIINQGPAKVTLVKVSAGDAATGVVLVGGAAATPSTPPTRTPAATPTATATAGTPSGSASASARATATATPSPIPSRPPGEATFALDIAASSIAVLVPGQGAFLQLVGLTAPLLPGESVTLTFTFADGSSGRLEVPVGAPRDPHPRVTPHVDVNEVHPEEE